MTSPEYLTRDDRRVMLQNIEGLQRRLTLVAHRLISAPLDPLPSDTWTHLDIAQDSIVSATRHWVN